MGIRPAKRKGVSDMGLTHVAVTIKNFVTKDSYTGTFLIDTRAMDCIVPAPELKRIGIEAVGSQTYETAGGELVDYQYGLAEVSFLGEIIATQVVFGPDTVEPLLGVIALESAGFVVDPVAERLRKVRARSLKRVA
jgi:predicted aspartyl protease